MTAQFNFNITYSVLLKAKILELGLSVLDIKDAKVDTSSKFFINGKLLAATVTIVDTINPIFLNGISFTNLLEATPICWLNID